MTVVHGIWGADDRLLLWGEDPAAYDEVSATKPTGSGVAHPFAASTEALREVVEVAADERLLRIELPSAAKVPLASPALLRGLPSVTSGAKRLTRAPWDVPAVGISASDAVDVLRRLAARGDASDSVRYLARAVELALGLVARGRVLPALVADGDKYQARWRTLLGPGEQGKVRQLARSMPPVTRVQGADLRQVVDAVADAVVRGTLQPEPLLSSRRRKRLGPLPAAEALLDALGRDDAIVEGDASDLTKLAGMLADWRRSAQTDVDVVRVCFRLIPPPEEASEPDDDTPPPDPEAAVDTTPWLLELLLQPVDDPSLLVPAAQVWTGTRGRKALAAITPHPEERLLQGLGRACRLYPALERVLDEAKPTSLELDAAGAADFLRNAAPVLDQAGFGVIVPSWWKSRRRRLGARLKATTSAPSPTGGVGGIGMDALIGYQWEVALGDANLTKAELTRLARLKQPLVRVRGEWVELHEDDLRAALRLIEHPPATTATAGDALKAQLGLGPDVGLPVVGVEADGWLGELLRGAESRAFEPIPTPEGFVGTLRPYQERGLAWLSFLDRVGFGAVLADDMGLGKTAQLIALVLADRTVRPTLVVCPMSVVGNWQREIASFAPELTVHVHHGVKRTTGQAFAKKVELTDIVLTTYSLAARDVELLRDVEWGRVVLDEAQNVKNSGARQTRAVRSLPTARRVALTGTPVENRLSELWSIMEFANPGLLGSESVFRERFAIPIERYGEDEPAELLRKVTAPFVLRRLKTDKTIIADLPEKLEMKVYCNLTREQATLYQAVVDDMLKRIDESEGMERRGLVLSTMLKLKQVCNHPAQLLGDASRLEGRSGKLARIGELLEEVVAEGDRALVFTQFAEMGTMLNVALRDRLACDVLWLHGGTPKRARDQMVERFQAMTGPAVFLLSLKAGGTGLNLTAANHVVHFDRWWNPAVEDQATDRAFRIGQRRDVQVRKLVCIGTLEERIDAMIETKRALAERIVGTGESWLTELSTDALREIVALSADAVAEG